MNAERSLTIMSSRHVIAVVASHIHLKVDEYTCGRSMSDVDATDAMEGMSGQQQFKVNTYHVIIDQLKIALQKRIEAYSMVLQRF